MSGRCKACNAKLNDFEMTRKYADSKTYVDLCNHCFSFVKEDIPVIERDDLMREQDIDTDFDEVDKYEFISADSGQDSY